MSALRLKADIDERDALKRRFLQPNFCSPILQPKSRRIARATNVREFY
jgi:hypothetical protein